LPQRFPNPEANSFIDAASRITSAAIQSGAVDAKDINAVSNYFFAIHQRLISMRKTI